MDQVFQVSLDESGRRIRIPPPLREHLHLSSGMIFVVEEDEQGNVHLHLQPEQSALIEKDGILVARVTPLGDLHEVIRDERERRVSQLLQRVAP